MSTPKDNTVVAPAPSVTTETPNAPSGEKESKDKKVVETVDFRASAGQDQAQDMRPVAVVHEPVDGAKKPAVKKD